MAQPSKTNQVTISYSGYQPFGGNFQKGRAKVRTAVANPLKPNKTAKFIK